ncbi:homoprotocatechuate degradation operon regulator HpaR [Chelativorans sp. AA-79]|uniref:homoprotocatechuate degradation operon regulator HpaR n=1 Tax=Chelativorans sp. AA-79 TaxID=3028735 RepID=UPI003211EEED
MTLINAKDLNSRAEMMPRLTRRSLTIALLRSREKLMSRMRPLLASHNITEQQWRVLRAINEEQEVDATDVAQRSCIMAPSLTRILRHLEERGLIARRRDVNDGRRTMLSMTDKGVRLIAEVAPESRRIYGDVRARFGEERFELLLDLLEKFNNLPEETGRNLPPPAGRESPPD